jgi:hypothetical protein
MRVIQDLASELQVRRATPINSELVELGLTDAQPSGSLANGELTTGIERHRRLSSAGPALQDVF